MRHITDLPWLWSKTSSHFNLYCFLLILFSVLCGDFHSPASCTISALFLTHYWRDLFVFLRLVWLACLILLLTSLFANNSRNETDNQIAWLTCQVCCFDILQQLCSLNRIESIHRENNSMRAAKSSKYVFCNILKENIKDYILHTDLEE